MTNFLNKFAAAVIIDCNAPPEALQTLNELNISTVLSAKIDNIITDLSTHPDMQIFHLHENIFVCEPSLYEYYSECLSPRGIIVLKGGTSLTSNYPGDIAYNAARIGDILLHRIDKTDGEILRRHTGRIVNVKQGYTKCSVCVVNENAVITSDRGISIALRGEGVDVLEIPHGEIILGGFEYGFIGGCSGLIAKNKLAFCGDITKHSAYVEISKFLKKHKVDIISLCDQKLVDIGSIIPIWEE